MLHTNDQGPSSRYVWYAIALLCVVNVFNYMDRMALAVLLPFIKADLELSDAQLGLILGFAFSLFYAICGLPIARWADRGVRRNIIAITLATWSVMTALSGAAQNFWHLFLARVGIGVGEAGCLPTGQSMICDYVPDKRRAGIYALHTFGLVVGMMLGMGLAGWLGETIGWRWSFVLLGIPGLALAVIVRLTLREPRRGAFDAVDDTRSELSFTQTMSALRGNRTYVLLVVFSTLNGFVNFALTQWWPSLYTRLFGLGASTSGAYLGIALGAGDGIGLLLGGLLGNRVAQRDLSGPLMISVAATFLATPVALGSLFVESPVGSILLVFLTGVLWSLHNGPVVAMLYGSVAPAMRATAGAISVFLMSALGFGLGPVFVGVLSDFLAPELGLEALRYALVAPVCLLPLMSFVLYAAAKSVRESHTRSSPRIQARMVELVDE